MGTMPPPQPPATPQQGQQSPGIMTQRGLTKAQVLAPQGLYEMALRTMIDQKIRGESDKEQYEVFAKIRRNNLYYRGFQYLQMVRGQNGSIDYKPVGSSQGGGMDVFSPLFGNGYGADPLYDNTLALFRGDVRKWCGVLGVRSPNAKCEPRTVGVDHQIRLSRIGDRAISYLRDTWQADELQRYLSYSLAVNGTTFGYVNLVSDASKYGVTEIPQLQSVEVPIGEDQFVCSSCGAENSVMSVQGSPDPRCAQCGTPLGPEDFQEADRIPSVIQKMGVDGKPAMDRYANAAVEIQLATGATVKTPYYIRDLDHCPWLWYEYYVNRYELIRTYCPSIDPADKSPEAQAKRELRAHLISDKSINNNSSSTEEVRRTQNTLSSPSGMPLERRSLASFAQYFLSPGQMEAIGNGDDTDNSGQVREQLIAKYPDGMHLVYLNGKLADVRKKKLTCHWSICQPDTGEFIYRDAVFDDYIQGQDVINDSLNILIQQAEKSNPLTVFDPDYLDPDRLRDRSNQVGEFVEGKKIGGSQIANGFYKIQGTEVNKALVEFIEFYIQKNRENVGILPAIYGGGEADEAVGVAKIRRNQSLMQLNVPWNYMRDFWSQTYTNGIMLLAKYSNGKLYTNRGGVIEMEELDGIGELQQGGIVVQCEEAMPMTWAQRQEQVESMLARPPQAWALLGVTDQNGNVAPANVEILQDAVGMPDWIVPGLDARERLLDIIQQLLQADPQDSPPDPMTGQSGPPQSSVQPNQTMFDAPFAVQVLRDWLVSDKGNEAETNPQQGQSPRGFENVLAYTQAWMQIANAPPPAAPAPPPEPPRVSVSVKPTDLLIPGVAQIMSQDFNIGTGLPPPPGTETPPQGQGQPPAPNAPPLGTGGPPSSGPPGGPGAPPSPPPDQRMPAAPPPGAGALNGAPGPTNGFPSGPVPGGLQ